MYFGNYWYSIIIGCHKVLKRLLNDKFQLQQTPRQKKHEINQLNGMEWHG